MVCRKGSLQERGKSTYKILSQTQLGIDIMAILVDMTQLSEQISVSHRVLSDIWKDLPHIIMPGTKGTDGRSARFSVEDVVEYLRINHGVNYGDQIIQDEKRRPVSGGVVPAREKGSKQSRVRNQKGRKKVDTGRRAQTGKVRQASDDPHGLRIVGN